MKEKIIIIGGGVGPMAGVELHKKIIENTLTDGTDQTHIEIYHLSRSHDIQDRTKFLFKQVKEDPAEGMFRTFEIAEKAVKKSGKEAIAGIPCNSFHAPKIWKRFVELMKDNDIKVLHMIEETSKLISKIVPNVKRIGLMSTIGTRSAGFYRDIFEPLGFNLLEIPEDIQHELHDSIYNKKWGIKAVSPVSKQVRDNFEKYVHILKEDGVEAIILGCTEIPLALPKSELEGIPLIDPMFALARSLIREANPNKLKPL
jgi:aspartate racemase